MRWQGQPPNEQGKAAIIVPESTDEGLTADWMDDNMGFHQTTIFLNQHRTEEGRMHVGRIVVMTCFDRMNPKVDRKPNKVQGGSSEAWQNARKQQMKQLLVMQKIQEKSWNKNTLTVYPRSLIQINCWTYHATESSSSTGCAWTKKVTHRLSQNFRSVSPGMHLVGPPLPLHLPQTLSMHR